MAGQLDAYNARDLERFTTYWAQDLQVYTHPHTLLYAGQAELRQRHAARFQEPDLHAHLLHRRAIGHIVMDQERVTRTFPEGRGTLDVAATYEVTGGLIRRAWFLTGTPALHDPPEGRLP